MSHRLPPVVALRVVLLAGASWALWRELRGTTPAEIVGHLSRFGAMHVLLALALAATSFLLLGVVEVLALRAGGGAGRHGVPIRVALSTGFVANALSQSIGLAVLTGTAVRARAYGRRGMNTPDVAEVSAFVTLAALLGLLAAGAVALAGGASVVQLWKLSMPAPVVSVLLAVPVSTYLLWSVAGHQHEVGVGRWKLRRPSAGVACGQVLTSTADWVITGGVLFVFLAPFSPISFPAFLKAYILAQTAAVSSHVPAGAGVLELMLLAQLAAGGEAHGRAGLVAGLVMFRVMYYLLPLIVAVVLAAVSELRARHRVAPAERLWATPEPTLAEDGA